MADSAAHNSSSGPVPPLSRAPSSRKNLTRHVSFSETHLKPPHKPESEDTFSVSSSDTEAQQQRLRKSPCNTCCAWGSLVIGTVILLILLAGAIFFAFLQANLPEFRVHRLDVHKLTVTTTKKDTLLTGDFEIRVNATNKNDNNGLTYSPLTVEVSSEDIILGRMQLPALTQKARTTSDLKIRTAVSKETVNEDDAKDLQTNSKEHLMSIDVIFTGTISFVINGKTVNGFPFKVACKDIYQSEIDAGHAPECNVKISLL